MKQRAILFGFILVGIIGFTFRSGVWAEEEEVELTGTTNPSPTMALERSDDLVPTVAAKLTQAAEQLQSRLTQAAERKTEIEDRVETTLRNVCANIEAKIALTITRYENNKDRHVANYQELKAKLSEKIDRLAVRGYDVTELRSKLTELDGLIQTFAADYALFVEGLRTSQEYACGKSEGEFRNKLQESRELLRQVRADTLAIRLFYQQEIRPLMVELLSTPVPTPIVTEGANE